MKYSKRTPFKQGIQPSMLTCHKPKRGDKSMTRTVTILSSGRQVIVGYIFLPDPGVMRYAFRTVWMDHPSTERFKTLTACKAGLGAKL